MMLIFDIGNTHTNVGLGNGRRILKDFHFPTCDWKETSTPELIGEFQGSHKVDLVAFASVQPKADRHIRRLATRILRVPLFELNAETASLAGLKIDYPNPATIGADRLANAIAARKAFGAPVVVVDFGTAVTFDVVDKRGCYAGGIIAPGLNAMTDYLHDKTALLPRIEIRETRKVVGKSTTEAMLIGAVKGYRGMIHRLIEELETTLKAPALPVIATGGYARLIAKGVPRIKKVAPLLTLEGIRLAALSQQSRESAS